MRPCVTASWQGASACARCLVIAAAEANGAKASQVLNAACALECLHTYSLIHDDLPAMDNDDLRRGKPTNHKAFDEATAILAGDGLLTLAFELMASSGQAPQGRATAALGAFAMAAGSHRHGGRPDGRCRGRGKAGDRGPAQGHPRRQDRGPDPRGP